MSTLGGWLAAPIRGYRRHISPALPPTCRYTPTCSEYAVTALTARGPLVGLGLTLWRLLRCAPWGGSGWDPVPPRRTLAAVRRARGNGPVGLYSTPRSSRREPSVVS